MGAPLDGVVVVSLEAAISAPYATRQLADLGATVIKVERPGGDFARRYDGVVHGESVFFVWGNRGKHSVELDLRDEADAETLACLVAGADVFVHNMSPRAARDLGIDPGELAGRHPSLVIASVSGYGSSGPRSEDKAYDLAIQAEAGAFSVTGDAQMSKVGFSIADICAATTLVTSILAALVRRERTGEGAVIEVSMLDALTEWMTAPLLNAVHGGGQPPRTGRRHHAIAPYGTFALLDGSVVLVAVQNDEEWRRLAADVLGEPALGTDPRFATNAARIARVDEVESLVAAVLGALGPDEARAALARARIVVADVNDLDAVWHHEQLRGRDRFVEVGTPTGPVEVPRAAFGIAGWEPPGGRVPALGEADPDVVASVIARGSRRTPPPTRL